MGTTIQNQEPYLCGKSTYCLFPLSKKDQPIFDFYKHHLSTFWTSSELNFENLKEEFAELPDGIQTWIKHILAFFASSDLLINSNIMDNFLSEITNSCCQQFYAVQACIEAIHSEVYSLLIDNCIADKQEKKKLFYAIETMPVIKKKAEFVIKRMDDSLPLSHRLFCFQCFEGIAFSSSFCGLYYLKTLFPGKVSALVESNKYISRDETIHADFGAMLQREYVQNKMSSSEAHDIVRELLDLEKEFIEVIPCDLILIDSSKMLHYIEYCADIQLVNAGFQPLFNHKESGLKFMNSISMYNKSNFFEVKATEYAMVEDSDKSLTITDDF